MFKKVLTTDETAQVIMFNSQIFIVTLKNTNCHKYFIVKTCQYCPGPCINFSINNSKANIVLSSAFHIWKILALLNYLFEL